MLRPNRLIPIFSLAFCAPVLLAVGAFADSQARVVRLSDVQGEVKIDRNTGAGMEKAFLNLPLTQGAKIDTGSEGRAEVEFEDSSTLRMIPATVISFTQLSLKDAGGKVSSIRLQEGTAYINYLGAKGDELSLAFGHETITVSPSTHVRIVMGDTDASVAVLKGDATLNGPSGSVEVAKDHTVNFDLLDQDKYKLAKGIDPEPFDDWDKAQDQYHQRYAANNSAPSLNSQYAYGTSDLNYYGSWFDAPGYGSIWQPFLIGAGWNPFLNGAWSFYPGYGYSWVSSYPWGWTPYHSGSWIYLPTYGWVWQPGNNWSGTSIVNVVNPPATFQRPIAPVAGQKTIPVNNGPMPTQLGRSNNRLMIPENSAGLGVPRGGIKNLSDFSRSVQKTGFANTRVHTEPVATQMGWFRSGYSTGTRVPGSGARPMHSVSAPSVHSSGSSGHASMGGGRVK